MSLLVPALALGSGLCSAVATVLIRQGLRGGDWATGLWINVAVGTAGFWLVTALTGGPGRPPLAAVALFGLAGLIGTVGGRFFRFIALERVGTSITAALINVNPLVASALAVLVLGERVTPPLLAGTVVIVAGTMLLSAGGKRAGVRLRWLVLPLLSAACFGVVAVLRKLGLASIAPAPGAAINSTAALIAVSAFVLASRYRPAPGVLQARSVAYFVAAGTAENAGVFLGIVALSIGTVSVVAPLTGAAPIFVLVLSRLFLRGLETTGARVVAGTLLIVLGVYLVTALAGR